MNNIQQLKNEIVKEFGGGKEELLGIKLELLIIHAERGQIIKDRDMATRSLNLTEGKGK